MNRLNRKRALGLSLAAIGIMQGCRHSPNAMKSTDRLVDNNPPLLSAQIDTPVYPMGSQPSQDNILPAITPLDVRGNLLISSSDAMTRIIEAMTERFVTEGFSGELEIERMTSKEGFEMFCQKSQSDVVITSRAITDSERQTCAANGREPVVLEVGADVWAIVVGENNNFITETTRTELTKIFTSEYWSDVRSSWPLAPIRRTLPELDDSALTLFADEVLEGDLDLLVPATSSDFFSEDETDLVQTLLNDQYTVAFLSYADYERNQDVLKLVSIEGTNIRDREQYPFIQPIYLYADASTLNRRPQVGAFLNFFLTHATEEISSLGYFPLRAEKLNETKTVLRQLIN